MPEQVRSASLAVLAVLAAIFALQWAQAFLIPLVLGVFISLILDSIVTWMAKWKIPRAIGAAVLLTALIGLVGYSSSTLEDGAEAILDQLPQAVGILSEALRGGGSGEGAFDKVQKIAAEIEKAASEEASDFPAPVAARDIGLADTNTPDITRVEIVEPSWDLRNFLVAGSMGAATAIGQAVMVLFLVYFLLVSGDLFKRKLAKIAGPTLGERRLTIEILNDVNTLIKRSLLVKTMASIIVGVAAWITLYWIGLEQAAVLGLTIGVLNFIPYLGPAIGIGITALVALLQFETLDMALLTGVSVLAINSIEGLLLVPWLTSRTSQMNAVAIFVGLLFWAWLWGPWGLLLGIPITLLIKAICDRIERLKPIGVLMDE